MSEVYLGIRLEDRGLLRLRPQHLDRSENRDSRQQAVLAGMKGLTDRYYYIHRY